MVPLITRNSRKTTQIIDLLARQSLARLRDLKVPASAEVVDLFTNLRFALRLGSTTLAFSVQPANENTKLKKIKIGRIHEVSSPVPQHQIALTRKPSVCSQGKALLG